MKIHVRKIVAPRIICPKLKKKVELKQNLSREDQYLLADTLGVNDKLREKYTDVEEYYQELCYSLEGYL